MTMLGIRWTRACAALLALSLVAAGCGDDDDTEATGSASAPTDDASGDASDDGETLAVTLTAEGVEGLPEEVGAGAVEVEITNEAGGPASFELVKGKSGATAEEVAAALETAQQGETIPDTIDSFVGSHTLEAGSSATLTMTLTEGTWFGNVLVEPQGDGEEPQLGTPVELAVTEGVAGVQLPETESTVTARDYEFDVEIVAGASDLAFLNEGPDQLHHAIFFAMAEGIEEEAARSAVETFLASEDEGPPPSEFDFEGPSGNDTNVAGPGHGVVQPQGDFEAGRTYAVVCFIQDRAGGPPHAVAHDMWDVFTVAD